MRKVIHRLIHRLQRASWRTRAFLGLRSPARGFAKGLKRGYVDQVEAMKRLEEVRKKYESDDKEES